MAAKWVHVEAIGSYFESLSDPRHPRNRKHLLVDIVVIAVCGTVCGYDGPTALHRWAANRRGWLGQFLALPDGIPSRDCIRRLLMALKPEAFQDCFRDWITDAVRGDDDGSRQLIALDGKTCRRSHDAAQGLGPLHIVSAWASEEGVALGQIATAEKSDEIAAIPWLLEQIDLTGSVIAIDAMGCQKEIAGDIVAAGGDFVIGVKDASRSSGRRSRRTSRSTWSATRRTSALGAMRRARRRTAGSTSGRISSPGSRTTSRSRRSGRGSRRSAVPCG
jgi:hypothetical protein